MNMGRFVGMLSCTVLVWFFFSVLLLHIKIKTFRAYAFLQINVFCANVLTTLLIFFLQSQLLILFQNWSLSPWRQMFSVAQQTNI